MSEPKDPSYTGEEIEEPKEVERKFLIDPTQIPTDIEPSSQVRIYQAYVALADDGSETRVRMSEPMNTLPTSYELTVKTKGGISRGERSIPISEEMYYSMSDSHKREGNLIVKLRLTIPYEDVEIELDLYDGDLHGLVVAEVEFHGETEAEALAAAAQFVAPSWFGQEVTDEAGYKNKNLALHGHPQSL